MINLSEVNFSRYIPSKKIILGIIAAIIIGEVIWAGWTLLKPSVAPKVVSKASSSKQAGKASIVLQAAKSNIKVGEKVAVTATIASDKPAAGMDLVVSFDPNLLSVENKSLPVTTTTLLDDYPFNQLDEGGKISVSGISSSDTGKVLNGILGTITFVAKAPGKTKVTVDFTKGSTVDSNVTDAKTAKDLLNEVKNVELNITQ